MTQTELHPDLRRRLQEAAGMPPTHELPIETARDGLESRGRLLPLIPVGSIEDRTMVSADRETPIRIYRPQEASPRPPIIYFHGGGFVLGSIESHDPLCRRLCLETGFPVVSVGYALAPEHRFPAALDDCMAAIGWTARTMSELGFAPGRFALAGDSAGACLALACALLLDETGGPRPSALALAYPVTDAPDLRRPSYTERGTGFGLTAETMLWFFEHYLDDPALAADPRVSPVRSNRLGTLPPTYLSTAEFDPLRDEGIELAQKLARNGVDINHVHHADANHGFIGWAGFDEPSAHAIAGMCDWLMRKMG